MTRYQTITVEKRGHVDWLTLNRPDALNAISVEMVGELNDYFGRLYNDATVRLVVMRGAGRAFCAGLDIKQRDERDESEVPFGGGFGFQGFLADVYIKMRRCPQPIISLIHGAACGGGFAFALASDVRIGGESMKMNAAFIRIGLSACDMGVSYFLPRLLGVSIASELMLTGRFIHAPRALATGLVSEVVPDDQLEGAAQAYVDEMLRASPMGLRMTKEGLNMAVDAATLPVVRRIGRRDWRELHDRRRAVALMAKIDPALLRPERYPFQHVITTRFADVDPNRHINNVALAAAFEDGRYRFDVSRRFHEWMEGYRVMIAANHIDYVGEAHYPAPLDLHVGTLAIGRTSWQLACLATQEGRPCAFARATLVATIDGKSAALTAGFRNALDASRLLADEPA